MSEEDQKAFRMSDEQRFKYEDIELFKSENLGAGSYGVVCKAKCNNLLCAAKIIYPILFDSQEPAMSVLASSHLSPVQRFEQECQVLSQIHHPHIVQYLQTHRDPETGSSILLMELMDENLTHFLQSQQSSSVPLHLRVMFSHGIVLALTFLHSNGIIHRDLSANNILINDKVRAKVTDFGMSMFTDSSGSRTLCPGTLAYMPPEALNDPPVHSEKLDCFSFGALIIQICTKLWPDPNPRFSTYRVQDPRDPSKTTEAQFSVPEQERRRSHLDLIDSTDILYPIALSCIKDDPDDRPSAQHLCCLIDGLKETEAFTESIASHSSASEQMTRLEAHYTKQRSRLESELQRLRETIDEAHTDIQERNQMLDIRARQLQKVSLSLAERDRENERLKLSIVREGDSKMMQSEIIESLEKEIEIKDREIAHLEQQMEVQNSTIRDQRYVSKNEDYQLRNMQFDLSSKGEQIRQLQHQLTQAQSLVSEKDGIIQNKKKEVRTVENLLTTKMKSFQDTLQDKDKRIQDLEQYLASNDEHLAALQKEVEKLGKVDAKDKKKFKPKPVPRFKKDGAFHIYRNDHPSPIKMHAGSTASLGSCIYFRPYNSREIYKFDLEANRWSVLPEYVESAFTLSCVQETLVCVGGQGSKKLRGLVVDGSGVESWVESYPDMLHQRANCCAASTPSVLIVAGGLKQNYSTIASVEVLQFVSSLWSSVVSLPYPLHGSCATICGEHVYLGGGYFMKSKSLFSTLSCSLSTLLSPPSTSHSLPRDLDRNTWPHTATLPSHSLPRDLDRNTWHHTATLPVCRASFVSFQGQLFAIGGKKSDSTFSNAIYKYNNVSNRWEDVCHMHVGRSNCLVGVLGTKIIIVGGICEEGISSDIEFVTL